MTAPDKIPAQGAAVFVRREPGARWVRVSELDDLVGPEWVARYPSYEAPPFLIGWSWNVLLDMWREFVTGFKMHCPDASNMVAVFDALVALTFTIQLGDAAWEQVRDDRA